MVLTPELSRLAKMLIDAEGITHIEAEARLRAMTLEIIVGCGAHNVAGHNAILTAVAVGRKTFAGGVAVRMDNDANLLSALPVGGASIREAAEVLGAAELAGPPSARIAIGGSGSAPADFHTWWDGWSGGSASEEKALGGDDNPLAGIMAGAAAVTQAFAMLRGAPFPDATEFNLWPRKDKDEPPAFGSVYFPGSLWLLGLGNLGQAILWALSALPYPNPSAVKLVLQDADRISAENWGTSVLVQSGQYGAYKTALGEAWATRKGFDTRRVDRLLDEYQRVQENEPVMALCGFDSVPARKIIDGCGFEIVVDAGLGRAHTDFDVYRVTVFDGDYSFATHFPDREQVRAAPPHDYEGLLGLDQCGAVEFEGIGVAAPFVSSIAAATVVARAIAICSSISVPRNERRRLSGDASRLAAPVLAMGRGIIRVGH